MISSIADCHAEHGVIFRNPKPHVRSIHAYFPSIVVFDDQHLGALLVLGEAFEAPDLHLVYFESRDRGKTWARRSTVTEPDPALRSSTVGRISRLPNGELAVMVTRHQREPFDEGLTDGTTIGMRPMTLELYRSCDEGATWTGPEHIAPPIAGTAFEMCSSFTALPGGVLLWPASTWPLSGQEITTDKFRTGACVSTDNGRTWPRWIETFPNDETIYWESKIITLPDGRLLGVAWVHELATGNDRPNHFVIGSPDATQWSAPRSMGICGQTLTSIVLDDGRILSVYRRVDEPGLWGTVSRLEGEIWTNEEHALLWRGQYGASGDTDKLREHFATLKFGAPFLARLPDGSILIAFWCVVDNVSQVNTILLSPK